MKRIIISVLLGFVLLSSVSIKHEADIRRNIVLSQNVSFDQTTSVLRANHIIWKYKIINGKLWKRKYDVTAHVWIGDWILAE